MANIAALLAALANLPQFNNDNPLLRTPGINPAAPALPAPTFQPDTSALPMEIAAPSAPPPAPSAPINPSIIQQYLALAGPAPTPPPTAAPMGTLERIALALQGFGAGFQGQGPQFLQSVRAERERPQREFEEQTRQYEQRRSQLGVRGFEAAQSAEERRQDRENRAAERQFDREFSEFARRNRITDEMALDKIREAREIQLTRERERIADERLAAQQKQQDKIKLAELTKAYRLAGAGRYATELAERDMAVRDNVSAGADKWLTAKVRLDEARATRAAAGPSSGGGASSGNVQAQIIGPDGSVLGTLPYSKIKFNRLGEPEGFPEGSKIRLSNQAQPKPATKPQGGQQTAKAADPLGIR